MKGLRRQNQVIFYIADMPRSLEFYQDKIGLPVTYPGPDCQDFGSQKWVTLDGGAVAIGLHAGGEKRIGEDAASLTFFVDDVAKVRQELGDNGLAVGEIVEPHPGVSFFRVNDPDGNVIFVQQA